MKRGEVYMENVNGIPWEAILGLLGTLLGTIVGWWLSRAGKIESVFTNVAVEFLLEPGDPYNMNIPKWKQSPKEVMVEVDTLIHNSKGIPVSLLNCDILLEYQDETVKLSENNIFYTEGDVNKFGRFINIGAFSVAEAKYKIHRTLLPHTEKLKFGYKLYFVCEVNGKKKIKRQINEQTSE